MIQVAVAGARGEMGRVAIRAIRSSEDLRYAGGVARSAAPSEQIYASIDGLLAERKPDVLLDFATRPSSVEMSMAALAHGVRPVVGSSGWTDAEMAVLGRMAEERGLGAMIVPNFSTGAALMMRLAEEAARFFPASEIVEMHRIEKKDKPSGTALETASRITRSARTMPEIHSVRLPGLVAHQEVLFASSGEMLTIRHDSFARESFVPGILAAVRAVMKLRGLTIGLDAILDEMRNEPFT